MPSIPKGKEFNEWLALRTRLLQEERALARGRLAWQQGQPTDVEGLAIKQSEVRALRALSRALMKRALRTSGGPDQANPDDVAGRPQNLGRS